MNPRELHTAVQMYQAALRAGATPNNALFLVGAAYQESSFNPRLTGSDSGTSYGLMQVGSGLWRQMRQAGVADDPVAQMTYYVNYLQDHQPGTWAAMQSAESVPGVYQSLYANRDWRLGAQTGRMAPYYADQLSQILNNESAPSNLNISDLVSGNFGAQNLPNLSDAYGLEQSYGSGYPVPTVSRANYPIVDFSQPAPMWNPAPSQEAFNPVDNLYRNPEPSWFENPTPVDSFRGWNPEPWNETLNPVDQLSRQPYDTSNLDYEPITPVDNLSQQPYDTQNLDYEPIEPVDSFSSQSSPGEITDNPFLGDPFQGVQGGLDLFHPQPIQQPVDLNAQSAGIEGFPGVTWNDLMNAPHTGEVFAATQVNPNTGRISSFDPATGGYTPVSGPGGWTPRGYGAGSAYGAGWAGTGGAGFGGYGGLGGSGAPQFWSGGMVDTSTPAGLSHGGADPSSDSSAGPIDAHRWGPAVAEGGREMKHGSPVEGFDTGPQLYSTQWNQARGWWTPAPGMYTTDPSLAVAMPAQNPRLGTFRSGFAHAPITSVATASGISPAQIYTGRR